MPGRGPAPKPVEQRRTRHAPTRGDWRSTEALGWQHGEVPKPPSGLTPAAREAWRVWFAAWFAAHWTPDDLPALRQLVRIYDQVERGEFARASEMRQLLDAYGITPKGQQDRRWKRPDQPSMSASADEPESPYAGLRVVS